MLSFAIMPQIEIMANVEIYLFIGQLFFYSKKYNKLYKSALHYTEM